MSDKGFVKLHRQLRDHPWLNEHPVHFMAWVHILMATGWDTGRVNLTEVYRDLGNHFETYNAWRAFIRKLTRHDMLTEFDTKNLGAEAGFQQWANVTKWFDYHPQKDAPAQPATREKWTADGQQMDRATPPDGQSETRAPQAGAAPVDRAEMPDGQHVDSGWTESKKNTSSLRSEVEEREEVPAREDKHLTSEERSHLAMTQGHNPNKAHELRAYLRDKTPKRWLEENTHKLETWANRWTRDEWDMLHRGSDLKYWKDAAARGAKQHHILSDLLEGTKTVPTYVQPKLTDNIGRKGTHPELGEIEIIGVRIDNTGYITASGDDVPHSEVTLWAN